MSQIEVNYSDIAKKREYKYNQKLLSEDFESLKYERLRKRIILEQDFHCNRCKRNEWMGYPIPLELEHKDGDNKNNTRENLEALCPNCHALTKTWRGRNKNPGHNRKRVSDRILFESLVKHKWNMRQALLEVGLSAKGGNYKRCHRLREEYNMASKH